MSMEQSQAKNDELQIRIGIAAAPAVSFSRDANPAAPLPNSPEPVSNDGFQINLEATLQYSSINRILNGYLAGKRFELVEGLINKHVVIEQAAVSANAGGNLLIRVNFSGSFDGIVYFTGKPVYDAALQAVRVADLHYELQSKSFLLNTAKWLLNNKIVSELNNRTLIPLPPYFDSARMALDSWLNREWTSGVRGKGTVSTLMLEEVKALPEHLLLRCVSSGKLVVSVSEIQKGK